MPGLRDPNKVRANARRIALERQSIEGDRPVAESVRKDRGIPSSAELVKLGVNQGGPPPKAKYL